MKNESKISTHRVITMLNRDEMEFLDKLGKDALFSTGYKLSYNDILEGLVDFAMDMGMSGEKVDSVKAFEERMLELLKRKFEHGG